MTPTSPPELAPHLWLDRYGDELYRYALTRVPTPDAAEELVQETLLSALKAAATFRGEASERTWLFVILKRKLIDFYRRQARHAQVSLDGEDDPNDATFFEADNGHWRTEQQPVAWESADGELEQQELRQALHRCQQKLPAQQEAVFALRFVEEQTAEEICQELGLTSANYWVLIHRAKLHLRRCLEKSGLGLAART